MLLAILASMFFYLTTHCHRCSQVVEKIPEDLCPEDLWKAYSEAVTQVENISEEPPIGTFSSLKQAWLCPGDVTRQLWHAAWCE